VAASSPGLGRRRRAAKGGQLPFGIRQRRRHDVHAVDLPTKMLQIERGMLGEDVALDGGLHFRIRGL
jgi:hypothetical protein